MSISWIGWVVFLVFYFVAWLANQIAHTTWLDITAIAAIVTAAALVFENRGVIDRRPQA